MCPSTPRAISKSGWRAWKQRRLWYIGGWLVWRLCLFLIRKLSLKLPLGCKSRDRFFLRKKRWSSSKLWFCTGMEAKWCTFNDTFLSDFEIKAKNLPRSSHHLSASSRKTGNDHKTYSVFSTLNHNITLKTQPILQLDTNEEIFGSCQREELDNSYVDKGRPLCEEKRLWKWLSWRKDSFWRGSVEQSFVW